MKMFALLLLAPTLYAAPDWSRIDKAALELLQKYIRIQSVNPPADTRQAAALVKSVLDGAGIPVRLYSSGPNGQTNLIARLPGRDRAKKPLLLLNHLDVVPVDRSAWKLDPFGGIVEGGQIWGRGSLDMKGIGVEQMMALITLKQTGVVPPRDIVMLSTADEETNGVLGIRRIGSPLALNKYTAAIQANTVSLTTLTAGVGSPPKVNVIPSTSEATLDCRLLPGVNKDEFISEMKARINDPRLSIELISTPDDPGVSNSRTPLFDAIRRTIVKHR